MSATPVPRSARRGRRRMLLTAIAALAAAAATALPARAAEITMFPERDFVEVAGLASGDVVGLEVWRAGIRVGRADGIAAFEEAPGTGFLVLVNHPGGTDKCWDGATPDIQPGDVIRATITGPSAGVAEATVADVTVTQPAQNAGGTITVQGTARTAAGAPLPLDQIEQRLIHAPGGDLFDNGTRRLSAPGDGTLAYDAAGNGAWTATYTGLSGADQAEAQDAESRILHLGNPLPNGEFGAVTIFEYGAPAGPGMPECPPLDRGPVLDMVPGSDTGASSTDNITRVATPVLVGARGGPTAGPTISLNRMVAGVRTLLATTEMNTAGGFELTLPSPLAEGRHELRAGQIGNAPGNPEILGSPLVLTIDTTAPTGIAVQGTTRPSPADDNAPQVRGFAEQGATIRLYGAPGCAGPPIGAGDAATFASAGIGVTVADNSLTVFHATAEDLAGNVSACVAGGTAYREVSPLARVLTARLRVTATWRARLAVACNALATSQCSGRLALTAKVTRRGTRREIVIGSAPYRVQGGRRRTIPVTLTPAGQALLAARGAMRAGVRVRPSAGSGLAATSRASLLLLEPPTT